MKAGIYARQSRTDESAVSVAAQVEECERAARLRGYDVVLVSDTDTDTSASKKRLERAGLDMIRAAYNDLDAVIFFRLDRLARSNLDFAVLVEEAQKAGVKLISATEPFDMSSPSGEAMATMIMVFARLESRAISARVASTIEYLKRNGRAAPGMIPWWMKRVPLEGGGMLEEEVPERVDVMMELIDDVLMGAAIPQKVRELNQSDLPAPKGGAWTHSTVMHMLRSPTMMGYVIHQGRPMRGEDGLPIVTRPELLSPQKFQSLQDELDRRGNPERRESLARELPITVRHDQCGTSMGLVGQGSKRAFVCPRKYSNPDVCDGASIRAKPLYDFVRESFVELFGEWREIKTPPKREDEDTRKALEQAKTALEELTEDRYTHGLFSGASGAERFRSMAERLELRITNLEDALGTGASEEEPLDLGRTLAEIAEDPARLRGLIRDFVWCVYVSKGVRGRKLKPGDVVKRANIRWTVDDSTLGEVLYLDVWPDDAWRAAAVERENDSVWDD